MDCLAAPCKQSLRKVGSKLFIDALSNKMVRDAVCDGAGCDVIKLELLTLTKNKLRKGFVAHGIDCAHRSDWIGNFRRCPGLPRDGI